MTQPDTRDPARAFAYWFSAQPHSIQRRFVTDWIDRWRSSRPESDPLRAQPGDEALRTALAALDRILNDAESKHPGGWGPDVTTVKDLRDARDAVALGLEHG